MDDPTGQVGSARLVTAYVDPDLDGVAACLLYPFAGGLSDSHLFAPAVFGQIDDETRAVLRALGLPSPGLLSAVPAGPRIALVDTHDPAQLPAGLPCDAVFEIVDHHPLGRPEAFPNAAIQNEAVGAAVTLLVERLQSRQADSVPEQLLQLAQAAIASNTLEFLAPSTTERDREAAEWLAAQAGLPEAARRAAAAAKRKILRKPPRAILLADLKAYSLGDDAVALAQVEAPGAVDLAASPGIASAIESVRAERGLAFLALSLVDTEAGTTTILGDPPGRILRFAARLGSELDRGRITLPYIALRKTHLLPALAE